MLNVFNQHYVIEIQVLNPNPTPNLLNMLNEE
jgi:hypothetical protein